MPMSLRKEVEAYLLGLGCPIIRVADHHLDLFKCDELKVRLLAMGWIVFATHAPFTGLPSGGTSRGCAILMCRRMFAWSILATRGGGQVAVCALKVLLSTLWRSIWKMVLAYRGAILMFCSRCATIRKFPSAPMFAMGDRNMVPSEFRASIWVQKVGVHVIDPAVTACTSGAGRTLDCGLVSGVLEPCALKPEVLVDAPTSPHFPVVFSVMEEFEGATWLP